MRYTLLTLFVIALLGCNNAAKTNRAAAEQKLQQKLAEREQERETERRKLQYATSQQKLDEATTEAETFYALGPAAKASFDVGETDQAAKYAVELSTLTDSYKDDWNYGNAIQDANLVLGRVALLSGDIETAKKHLIAAGNSPGSPQMDSFGPNMTLAKDLLEAGERETVLEYFKLCAKFWQMGHSELACWTEDVENGRSPDFGVSLQH